MLSWHHFQQTSNTLNDAIFISEMSPMICRPQSPHCHSCTWWLNGFQIALCRCIVLDFCTQNIPLTWCINSPAHPCITVLFGSLLTITYSCANLEEPLLLRTFDQHIFFLNHLVFLYLNISSKCEMYIRWQEASDFYQPGLAGSEQPSCYIWWRILWS